MGNQVATFLLTDKRQDSEFDLNPGTEVQQLLLESMSFPERDVPAAWYTAEDGRTKLLRYANGARGAYFEVIINEATQAETDNTLTKLRRWCGSRSSITWR